MSRTKTLAFQEKNIFFMDFTKLQTVDEVKAVMQESKQHIRNQAPYSLIALSNIEEMHFNNQIKDLFTEFARDNKPYIKASAIVGVTGLKQVLFNGIMRLTGRDVKCFSNIEMAKIWLVNQN